MTQSLKAFAANKRLTNNQSGATARIGELTTNSRSYTRNLQEFHHPTANGLELVVFSHTSAEGAERTLDAVRAQAVLEIIEWVYSKSTTWTSSTTRQDLVAAIFTLFGATVSEVRVDGLVNDGTHIVPSRLSFTLSVAGEEIVAVSLWFSDAEFEIGYDGGELIVVPPVDNIDIFLGNYASVSSLAATLTPTSALERVAAAAGKHPYTRVVPVEVQWIDPSNVDNKVTIVWYAITYGARSSETDVLLRKVADYIIANSRASENEWRVIFPDLFRITRFAFFPNWNQSAVDGRAGLPVIYSPFMGGNFIEECRNRLDAVAPGEFVINATETFNHPYRSVGVVSIPGMENREDALTLRAAFKSYIAVSSASEDFNRQSDIVRAFSTQLAALLRFAENYEVGQVFPSGYRVITRNGDRFIVSNTNNIELWMSVKNQG